MFYRKHACYRAAQLVALTAAAVFASAAAQEVWPSSRESNLFSLSLPFFSERINPDPSIWPLAKESNLFSLSLPFFSERINPDPSIWPLAKESSVFDLVEPRRHTIFVGHSGVFSLKGRESGIDLILAVAYSPTTQKARAAAYAYNRNLGVVVGTGQGSYRVSVGGKTTASGSMIYSPAERLWKSGAVSIAGSGTFIFGVTINGQTAYKPLHVGAGPPVRLTGKAITDNETGISGAAVKLYDAATIFSAANPQNLPAPLESRTTSRYGDFNFGEVNVGQYVLVLATGRGATVDNAFWLINGQGTHHETIVENPGKTDMLNRLLSLRKKIETCIVDEQTRWMYRTAKTVDADIDASPDTADWVLLGANLIAGTAAGFAEASAIGLSSARFGEIAGRVTSRSLIQQYGSIIAGNTHARVRSSIYNQTLTAKGALSQPYFAYDPAAHSELREIAEVLETDVRKLLDPDLSVPFLKPRFKRGEPVHAHSLAWFESLGSHQFAQRWLLNYYAEGIEDMPDFPENFSTPHAQSILQTAERQLDDLKSGSGLIFISPDPNEQSSSAAVSEPLALNLKDAYDKYRTVRSKAQITDWVKKGSSIVSIGSHAVAAVTVAGGVTLPIAAAAEVTALAASGVNAGASVIQANIKEDMAGTYEYMSAKYCANLLTAPLALQRVQNVILDEADSPYYLDKTRKFGGKIVDVDLDGVLLFGKEVFFPIQLKLLPFLPPIQMTSEKNATVSFANTVSGSSSAKYRVETKVRAASGIVYDHNVIYGGQLSAGKSARAQAPFRGYLLPNSLLTPATFEARLWTGPFRSSRPYIKDFHVVPINIGAGLTPFSSAAEMKLRMAEPLNFAANDAGLLTGKEVLLLADRVKERFEFSLFTGSNMMNRSYSFSNDVFSSEFRLYRPEGSDITFRIESGGEYIGWDAVAATNHIGFPGGYSGPQPDPEWIAIPNSGGRTFNVHVELIEVVTEPVHLLLEVWEQPRRNATLAALPGHIDIAASTGGVHKAEIAVGESSHQHPLEDVSIRLSDLEDGAGNTIVWTNRTFITPTNLTAGAVRPCELIIKTSGEPNGIYTGDITITSSNAGRIVVPVSVTLDTQAPIFKWEVFKEWIRSSNNLAVSWSALDNATATTNILFSYYLEGWHSNWSSYAAVTDLDLSEVSDGSYVLHVVARDQALNENESSFSTMVHIDRNGDLWKQRIVDFNSGDAITGISSVLWFDDFDGDGAENLHEFLSGTDPVNPKDLFRVEDFSFVYAGPKVKWAAKRGYKYQVMKRNSLSSGMWSNAPSGISPVEQSQRLATKDGVIEYIDTTAVISNRTFYKVMIEEQ